MQRSTFKVVIVGYVVVVIGDFRPKTHDQRFIYKSVWNVQTTLSFLTICVCTFRKNVYVSNAFWLKHLAYVAKCDPFKCTVVQTTELVSVYICTYSIDREWTETTVSVLSRRAMFTNIKLLKVFYSDENERCCGWFICWKPTDYVNYEEYLQHPTTTTYYMHSQCINFVSFGITSQTILTYLASICSTFLATHTHTNTQIISTSISIYIQLL